MRLSESKNIEYKRCLTDKFENEIVAFLNSREGGCVYIGVDDDGSVYGVENPDEVQRQISERIRDNICPEALGLYDISLEEESGKSYIRVFISSGTSKPYYLKSEGMTTSGCLIRVGSQMQNMTPQMIENLFARRTRNNLSLLPSPRQDLTFEQLKIYYQEHGKTLNNQFAKSLGFLTEDGKYNLNAYLFADENDITIKVAKFSGTNKVDLIQNEEYGFCSLIKACKSVIEKLTIEDTTYARITVPFRQERKRYDLIAMREAVINAFVHNDYTDLMSPTFFIYSDRIEISSYGGLIDGMTREELLSGCSRPRNREVMRVFRDVELVEQLGSGMNRMLETYSSGIFLLSPNFFTVRLDYENGSLPNKTEKLPNNCTINENLHDKLPNKTEELHDKLPNKTDELPNNCPINEELQDICKINGNLQDKLQDICKIKLPENTEITFEAIRQDAYATLEILQKRTGLSERTIKYHISELKKAGIIRREGSKKTGHWEVLTGGSE